MNTVLEYKCPSCGGAVSFDSTLQKLKCPYCDTELEVEALKELEEALKDTPQEELNWQTDPGSGWQEGEEEQLQAFVCQSCGGQITTEATTSATSCPYCGNPVVMAQRVSGELRPDCVIPFQLDKEAAQRALQQHFKGKPLLPKAFKAENHIREVKGVYVPFWLFDASVDANIRYHATRTRFWSDSNYNYTETSHFSLLRRGKLAFSGVPVDGSQKMADELMESLEPYDLSAAVDFRTAYLAGYLADRYDVTAQQSIQRANERIRRSTEEAFRDTAIGYATVVPEHTAIVLENSRARYALYPVWLLSTRYRGENYLFAMNGQTGKLVGDLPTDWGLFWKWFAGVAAGVTVACMLVALLLGLW